MSSSMISVLVLEPERGSYSSTVPGFEIMQSLAQSTHSNSSEHLCESLSGRMEEMTSHAMRMPCGNYVIMCGRLLEHATLDSTGIPAIADNGNST